MPQPSPHAAPQHPFLTELHHSERWFRSLVEHSSDMFAVLHADGSTKYASPTLERFLGVTPEQALRENLFARVLPQDLPLVNQEFARALSDEGQSLPVEFRFRRGDGAWRTIIATARNLLTEPDVRGIVVNSRDVTEQRELELQLQHAQKLDAVGRMAGTVAHDFNNLLTVIQGNVSLALGEVPAGSPGYEEIREIADAAQRAAALTRQLLAFSRQEPVSVEVLCANHVLQGMERLLARLVDQRHQLRLALDTDVGQVRADRGKLEQVLMNLVTNARDAMPEGGTVTIATSNEELRPEQARYRPGTRHGAFVEIAVTDTGVGMCDDVKQRIFEPFFTTKDRGKGTGLGLSTAYAIVQQFGGFMTVDSEPGRGSTFRVYLPRVATA